MMMMTCPAKLEGWNCVVLHAVLGVPCELVCMLCIAACQQCCDCELVCMLCIAACQQCCDCDVYGQWQLYEGALESGVPQLGLQLLMPCGWACDMGVYSWHVTTELWPQWLLCFGFKSAPGLCIYYIYC